MNISQEDIPFCQGVTNNETMITTEQVYSFNSYIFELSWFDLASFLMFYWSPLEITIFDQLDVEVQTISVPAHHWNTLNFKFTNNFSFSSEELFFLHQSKVSSLCVSISIWPISSRLSTCIWCFLHLKVEQKWKDTSGKELLWRLFTHRNKYHIHRVIFAIHGGFTKVNGQEGKVPNFVIKVPTLVSAVRLLWLW